jgi:hypothetical protein
VFQARRVDGGLEEQAERWLRRPRGSGGLLGSEAMALQRVGGEVMRREHPLNPAVIDGVTITIADNAREFTSTKGRRDRQPHDVLLDMVGEEGLYGGPAPRMGYGASIDQAQEAGTPQAPQIPPQPPVVHAGLLALLHQGSFACQDRPNGLIAGQDVLSSR